jgi:hypothetical protein
MRSREPGFVVQGFLRYNARDRPLLAAEQRRVFALQDDWGDEATHDIVSGLQLAAVLSDNWRLDYCDQCINTLG